MRILLQRFSNPRDFVKYVRGKMSLGIKELIAQKLLLRGKIKKVLSRAHLCSLEQRARNEHDQHEQTLLPNEVSEKSFDTFEDIDLRESHAKLQKKPSETLGAD